MADLNLSFVTLARVVKTQGRRGEVAVEVHSDVPDRLHVGLRVFALAEDDSPRELQIEDAWPHKDWLVLKFASVELKRERIDYWRSKGAQVSERVGKILGFAQSAPAAPVAS